MTRSKNNNKDIDIKNNNENIKVESKIQYKQMVLIILMTVIMIMLSLVLSFSLVNMLSSHVGGDDGHNSIIVPNKPKPPEDDKPGENQKPGHDHHKPSEDGKIIFSYEEKDVVGNGILIRDMFPTKDAVGKALSGDNYTFEFTLNFGKNSYNKYYEITAEVLDYTNLNGDYVKIYLETSSVAVGSVFNKDGDVKRFTEYDNATIDKENNREKKIYSAYISNLDVINKSRNFVLKMWVSEDMPLIAENIGKTFAIRINVYAK